MIPCSFLISYYHKFIQKIQCVEFCGVLFPRMKDVNLGNIFLIKAKSSRQNIIVIMITAKYIRIA